MRQEFTLYKRGKIWYGAIPDAENPEKRIRFSTGCRTKAEAWRFCQEKTAVLKGRGDEFALVTRDWWTDRCPYVKESKRNGHLIGDSFVSSARGTLDNHILPVFGKCRIGEITSGMIEDWKYSLVEDKGLSNKTANTYLSILNTMFDFWWRRGEITENPCKRVKRMRVDSNNRGILDPEEARRVLGNPMLWKNPVAYLANLLAACTGMRVGEVQALRAMDFTENSVIVRHNWIEKTKRLKCTKTGCIREIPLNENLLKVLLRDKLPTEFIFTYDSEYPMYRSCILRNLRKALARIGISEDEQRERGICVHGWRHFLNSRMRVAGIPDAVTRKVTGHSTEQMTEHYSHISAADAVGVLAIQSSVIPESRKKGLDKKSEVRTQSDGNG